MILSFDEVVLSDELSSNRCGFPGLPERTEHKTLCAVRFLPGTKVLGISGVLSFYC